MASNPQQNIPNNKKSNPSKYKNKQNTKTKEEQPRENKSNKKENAPNKNNFKSEPGPSSNQIEKTKEVLKDVLNVLECPVCLDFMRAPIFMCETGHNICSICQQKLCLPICPLCKESLTGQRNFTLEAIASKMGMKCFNNKNGCNYIATEEKIKLHYEDCYYRQLICPIGSILHKCSWSGSRKDLQAHFNHAHQNNYKLKVGTVVTFQNFNLYEKDDDVQLVVIGKNMFVYHVKIDVSRNMAFWSVQIIGSEKEAEKWRYEFEFFNLKNYRKTILISESCTSDNVSPDTLFSSGNCVCVPLFILKNFIDNQKLQFKFYVKMGRVQSKQFPNMKKMQSALNDTSGEYVLI